MGKPPRLQAKSCLWRLRRLCDSVSLNDSSAVVRFLFGKKVRFTDGRIVKKDFAKRFFMIRFFRADDKEAHGFSSPNPKKAGKPLIKRFVRSWLSFV